MDKTPLITGVLIAVAVGCFAVPSDVIYSDGEASVRYKTGRTDEVTVGDLLDTGDTLTTGFDGFVELDQAGLTIRINPDTVFALQEKEQAGEKAGVLALVLGSIKFRYAKLTGKEPMVQTGACVAGVRGTEFTVFAGADGSSLILVESGLVEVEAAGSTVSLAAEEGVEVRPGEPPGEKFAVRRDQVDYKSWNDQKIAAMLEDPEAALLRIADRMEYYTQNVSEYYALYERFRTELDQRRMELQDVAGRQGADAARTYDRDVVSPVADKTRSSLLNYRYFALAALSMRRYVAGRLYVLLKSRYILQSQARHYASFVESYREMLRRFEDEIVPRLAEVDI